MDETCDRLGMRTSQAGPRGTVGVHQETERITTGRVEGIKVPVFTGYYAALEGLQPAVLFVVKDGHQLAAKRNKGGLPITVAS